jgi:tetratricopeptide (TPR) repeat protein
MPGFRFEFADLADRLDWPADLRHSCRALIPTNRSSKTERLRRFLASTIAMPLMLLVGLMTFVGSVNAQDLDTVTVRRSGSSENSQRQGTIVEWKGSVLTLAVNGREKEIDNDSIVEIHTDWPAEYLAGLEQLNSGDVSSAIVNLQLAVAAEKRTWARRTIRADLIRAVSAIENHQAAIDQFLAITDEDPQTRFFHLCPLQWAATSQPPTQVAQGLIRADSSINQLIGASWLLAGSDRQRAAEVLDQLSKDIDPNIAKFAMTQLWRLRGLNPGAINGRQIQVWEKRIAEMPPDFRAGPWYVVAEAQSRIGQTDAAIINLMRIPILYAEQRSLSSAALYRSGNLLHNTGMLDEAQSVWNELKEKHPQSVWAQQTLLK